jgi:Fe-S oxidoreductase
LTLRDEYPHLAPAEMAEKAGVVARRTLLIDEFLSMVQERGELSIPFKSPETLPKVLFHGHCHQKAFADANKSVRLLEIAGYDVELANSACCGMAGMYGYEREHFEASRRACERALLPAVRAREDAELVVMGVSCRQQLEQFSGRRVRHLVEAVREAMA